MKFNLAALIDEYLSLIVVVPTIFVISYQAMLGQEVTMPLRFAEMIILFHFGKQTVPKKAE
ncbi:MAG: hypothetical protein KAJ03_01235 [Gammaproteobacteria bacterium]|nr:hypothetical protein [Gammaproteobacteria bacterium]